MFWLEIIEISSREETLLDDPERHIDHHLSTTLTSVSDFKNIIIMWLLDFFIFTLTTISSTYSAFFFKVATQKFPEGRNVTRKVWGTKYSRKVLL